jgi:hypothetical protein
MVGRRENFLSAVAEHRKPQWVPNALTDTAPLGGPLETFENGPFGGGLDGFGVRWQSTLSAGGAGVPAPGSQVLDNVCDWEDKVRFPHLDDFDWRKAAQEQLAGVDRSQRVLEYGSWNAQFLRFTHLLGFEEALIALIEEPEASKALLAAITDYKIGVVERVARYFKPDLFTSFDDVATEGSLFISPSAYRELIKPQHKRLNDAIRAYGMLPVMHTCGRCQELIEDFIDEGAVAWSSAQPMNDIVHVLQSYCTSISVIGGYDSNGPPGLPEATDEQVEAEVKRAIETYGPYGSYCFLGFKLIASINPQEFMDSLAVVNAAVERYCHIA